MSGDFRPDEAFFDRLIIREVIENWAVWRDAGDWERFRNVWHDDGYMTATWFQGTAGEFIRASHEGMDRGVNILHFLGGSSIDVAGVRAIAQTKMTISQSSWYIRCYLRTCAVYRTVLLDFFEKRQGKWAGSCCEGMIDEKTGLDPVDPSGGVETGFEVTRELSHGLSIPGVSSIPHRLQGNENQAGLEGRRG